MSLTSIHSDGRPDDLLARLAWRNRVVAILRVAVPLGGVLLFAALVGQIWLASLARQYGVAGITIDRGHLVVDTPQYTVTNPDGTRYILGAKSAEAELGNPNLIGLTGATLNFERPGEPAFFLSADAAILDTGSQIVDVPSAMMLTRADGLEGSATGVHADLARHVAHADAAVAVKFANGTTIDADTMDYDGDTKTWIFTRATVVIPGLPAAEE